MILTYRLFLLIFGLILDSIGILGPYRSASNNPTLAPNLFNLNIIFALRMS